MKKDFVHYQNHTRRDKKSQIETTVSAYSFENPKKSWQKLPIQTTTEMSVEKMPMLIVLLQSNTERNV